MPNKRGAPAKYKALLTPKNWQKIELYTQLCTSRDAIASIMGVNKDTLLKAIKEKGHDDFKDFQSKMFEIMRGNVKTKIYMDIMTDNCSPAVTNNFLNNYVIPFEEWNQKQEDGEGDNIKIVTVPVHEFSTDNDLQAFAEKQQAELMERLRIEMEIDEAENFNEEEDDEDK